MSNRPYSLVLGVALVSQWLIVGMAPGWASSTAEDVLPDNPLIQQAVADLARRESVPPSSIEVVSFEAVTWPDTSLGCPWPGMRYQQVPQDGARIILRVHGEQRVYHSGGQRAPFPCDHK